jgi:hypothetical protein
MLIVADIRHSARRSIGGGLTPAFDSVRRLHLFA